MAMGFSNWEMIPILQLVFTTLCALALLISGYFCKASATENLLINCPKT